MSECEPTQEELDGVQAGLFGPSTTEELDSVQITLKAGETIDFPLKRIGHSLG